MNSILVIISHPDDEIIWAGNMLILLQKLGWKVYVVCLSGNDPTSARFQEFNQVCYKLNLHGVIVGKPIKNAYTSLGNWSELIEQAFLALRWPSPSLVLSHSPYGDEFNHPHHVWCYQNAYKWSKQKKYPFSFFSFIKLPMVHKSKLKNLRKLNDCILSDFSSCHVGIYYFLNRLPSMPSYNNLFRCPKYYAQINFEHNTKKDIFEIYNSVGVFEHINNYSSFHLNTENIYFFDKKGAKLILNLFKEGKNKNLWAGFEHILIRLLRKIKKWQLKLKTIG